MVRGESPGPTPGVPSSRQQFPAHTVQLAHVAPAEAAQECPQRGWRLDRTAQHSFGPAGTQRVGIVDAVSPGQSRCHEGQYLVSRIRPPRCISQVKVPVNQLPQPQSPLQA